MLTAYETAVTNLLQAPSSPVALIPTAQLDTYINLARSQIAIESECIRIRGTLTVGSGAQQYLFSEIGLGGANGVSAPITVRTMTYNVAGGQRRVYPRPWPWFELYELSNPTPVGAPPRVYTQYQQGEAGSIYVNLLDTEYVLNIDTACVPVALTDNGTPEAIPYPWTDAVPFYAAWYAFMQLQRPADADEMLSRYASLMMKARQGSTPSVLTSNYEQQTDPTLANKLGSQPFRNAQDIGAGAVGGRSRPSR